MSDYTWTIADVVADGLQREQSPSWTWGDPITLRFRFDRGNIVGGVYTAQDRYESILDYIRSAHLSTINLYETQGRPRYEERLPDAATVDSLVVDIQPGDDVHDVDAVWAIVTGGTDVTSPIAASYQLELEVVPLAEYDVYDSRQDVEDALGASIV